MPGATVPLGFPYPVAGDQLATWRAQMQALAEALDDYLAALSAVAGTAPANLALVNGWGGTCQYVRRAGMVTLNFDGTNKGSWGAADLIGTLPAGFRPPFTVRGVGNLGGSPRYMAVNAAGQVQADAASSGGIYGTMTFAV